MSDDIQAGDVVQCISEFIQAVSYAPKVSGLYRVLEVYEGVSARGDLCTFLVLRNVPDGWWAERFRKLPPASDEFTADMRACRPADERIAA